MKFGISLYSYQIAYEDKKMNLEDCLKAVKALPGNVDGIEILADRTRYFRQRDYKGTLSVADQDRWKELIAKYEMRPTCYDSSLCDENSIGHMKGLIRFLNPSRDVYNDQMGWFKSEIDFCSDFGFPIMRGPNLFGIYEEVIRDSLAYALDKNVKICMEIHAPLLIRGEFVTAFAEMLEKTCPEAGGFVPDFGIFTRRLARPLIRNALAKGADPELVNLIDKTYDTYRDISSIANSIQEKTSNPAVLELLRRAAWTSYSDPHELKDIVKFIHHVHAKFYEVDENYVEHGIDFEGALKALKEIGYQGYISSEYEGQAYMPPEELNEVEQVRRQTSMTQNMLSKL
jgi:sugar phosphate isomerase/epimerase